MYIPRKPWFWIQFALLISSFLTCAAMLYTFWMIYLT